MKFSEILGGSPDWEIYEKKNNKVKFSSVDVGLRFLHNGQVYEKVSGNEANPINLTNFNSNDEVEIV